MKFRHLLAACATVAVVGCTTTPAEQPATTTAVEVMAAAANTIPGLYTPATDQAVIYYKRADNDYTDWGLHLWSGDIKQSTSWSEPLEVTGISEKYGAYYVIPLKGEQWNDFKFIIHMGNTKELGGDDQSYSRAKYGEDVFTYEGEVQLFADPK